MSASRPRASRPLPSPPCRGAAVAPAVASASPPRSTGGSRDGSKHATSPRDRAPQTRPPPPRRRLPQQSRRRLRPRRPRPQQLPLQLPLRRRTREQSKQQPLQSRGRRGGSRWRRAAPRRRSRRRLPLRRPPSPTGRSERRDRTRISCHDSKPKRVPLALSGVRPGPLLVYWLCAKPRACVSVGVCVCSTVRLELGPNTPLITRSCKINLSCD